jgi:hypothetical protein
MKESRDRAAVAAALLVSLFTGPMTSSALAFDRERPGRPEPGTSVPASFQFFIAAEGEADMSDRYMIEVGTESFDTILYTFDQQKEPKGWSWSDPGEFAPSDEEGDWWRGVFFRPAKPLPDGDYWWRAYKHDGIEYDRLLGEIPFRVDTTPPAPVTGLRVTALENGELQMYWKPVLLDEGGQPEQVAGYRIYRFVWRTSFRVVDRMLIGEMIEPEFLDEYAPHDEDRIAYYQINAVDEAGNEKGRKFPVRIGHVP